MRRWLTMVLSLVLFTACAAAEPVADTTEQTAAALSVDLGEGAALNVLFVGNSYTYGYDLPDVVSDIATTNGVRLETEMYAIGGASLADHSSDSEVRALISSGDFDVVVLQEQSQIPAVPQVFASESTPAAIELRDLANAAGAGVVLFQTWGHAEGSTFTGHTTYGAMQQQIIMSYDQLGEQLDAWVAPIGTAWREAMLATPEIQLHDADLSHPSPAGTYLAALVFADVFVVGPLTEAPDGLVDDETAAKLLQVAALVDEH